MVEQADQIRERERYFVMNDLNNFSTPKKRLSMGDDGSLITMLDKPIKRFDTFLDVLLDLGDARSVIFNALRGHVGIKSVSVGDSSTIAKSIWNNKAITPSGHKVNVINKIADIRHPDRPISLFPESSDMLDFTLPQKNNIVSDSVQSAGSITDRKQVVFRNNNISAADGSPLKSTNRRPDTTKATNYIFEKTLQNERSREYAMKAYLHNHIKWAQDSFTVSKGVEKSYRTIIDKSIALEPRRYRAITNPVPTSSAPYDMYLDSLSLRFIKSKKRKLSKYWNSLYYAYQPSVTNSFSNPTGVSSLNYSTLFPVLSKRGLLRLGSYTYTSPPITSLPNILPVKLDLTKKPQLSLELSTNNSAVGKIDTIRSAVPIEVHIPDIINTVTVGGSSSDDLGFGIFSDG